MKVCYILLEDGYLSKETNYSTEMPYYHIEEMEQHKDVKQQ